MAPLPPNQQVIAAQIYRNHSALIRRQLLEDIDDDFDDIDDLDDLEPPIMRMVGHSLVAQRALATDLAGYLYVASGESDDLDLEEVTGDAIREDQGGLEHAWHIPFFSMFGALAAGVAFVDALEDARAAVARQATTDLSLVQSSVMHELAPKLETITGFRRVTNGEGCAFCDEASDEEYSTFDLAPLHPGCNCSVAPIFEDSDPGEALNEYDRLDEIMNAGG
jgi:hypothetical protein